jgi:hypothetical protein
MPHEYKLMLKSEDSEEEVSLSGTLSDEDWERLNDFTDYADDLVHTKFAQEGMQSSLNIKWDISSGMTVSAALPNWDDVTVFLHKCRPIILQSESTSFYNIASLLSKELSHDLFRQMIKGQRDIYSGKRSQSVFRLSTDDVILNSEKILFDWLNAYEYHRDKDKQEFIDKLHSFFPLEASKVIFIGLLTDKMEAIYNLAALTRVVVGKQKMVQGKFSLPIQNSPI